MHGNTRLPPLAWPEPEPRHSFKAQHTNRWWPALAGAAASVSLPFPTSCKRPQDIHCLPANQPGHLLVATKRPKGHHITRHMVAGPCPMDKARACHHKVQGTKPMRATVRVRLPHEGEHGYTYDMSKSYVPLAHVASGVGSQAASQDVGRTMDTLCQFQHPTTLALYSHEEKRLQGPTPLISNPQQFSRCQICLPDGRPGGGCTCPLMRALVVNRQPAVAKQPTTDGSCQAASHRRQLPSNQPHLAAAK